MVTLLVGGYLHTQGQVDLGDVTAATLYVQALVDPVDRLISWLDELQVGADLIGSTSSALPTYPTTARSADAEPKDEAIDAEAVRFAYVGRP